MSAAASESKKKKIVRKSLTPAFIQNMVKKYGSPLLLIRRDVLTRQYENFLKKIPGVDPYFAVKSNPHPEIIKHFVQLGSSFDVASAKEIEWVLSAGAKPEKMIFANTIKSVQDIGYAHKMGVNMMTYDNEGEIDKIAEYAPGAKVLLRIKVANVGSAVELSLKFGAEPEAAIALLQKAKKAGLKPIGISFHVGSQCSKVENYIQALEIATNIFDQAEYNDMKMEILDIGGGFPIKYFDTDEEIFEKMSSTLRKEMARLLKKYYKNVRIIAEPGRYFVGPAGVLVTQIIGKAIRDNKNYYYLNDGIYQDFSGILFDHCKYQFKTIRKGETSLTTVAGPTCDSIDIISFSEELPDMEMKDILYVENIGAYSSASAVPAFNGIPPAPIILV